MLDGIAGDGRRKLSFPAELTATRYVGFDRLNGKEVAQFSISGWLTIPAHAHFV
jgi:hypothetical protein